MKLALRSLLFYWRTNLGVLVGAACTAAVLVGALTVGDSVRQSLLDQSLLRVGRVGAAIQLHERYARSALAEDLARHASVPVAPVLALPGFATRPDGGGRAGIVEVLGVDERFFGLAPDGVGVRPPRDGEVLLNRRVADQLGAAVGDTVLLRVEKPSLLPRDVALATIDDVSFAMRLRVAGIVTGAQFGRFGLRVSQVPPANLVVALSWLQKQLGLAGRVNVFLAGSRDTTRLDASVRAAFTLADAQLQTRFSSDGSQFELISDRVFLDDAVVEAVRSLDAGYLGVLTYFVNAFRNGERDTPYSTVCSVGPLGKTASPVVAEAQSVLPAGPGPRRIVINQWLADDLVATVGTTIDIDYFVMGPQATLQQRTDEFQIAKVVPITGLAADSSLMPDFPGLTDSENCRDWEPGIPIDRKRIRDKDEKYWDEHRGTPKAFLALIDGQDLFANRFGSLTAVRGTKAAGDRLVAELPRRLDPAALGLYFRDVMEPAFRAGSPATDFGGLFLGLSLFLVVAALILTSLLFTFGVGQRAPEIGMLLAVGYRRSAVRRQFLIEALVLAMLGSCLGVLAGLGYTRAVLHGLGTLWRGAVGSAALSYHASSASIVIGVVASVLVAVCAIALGLRRVFDHPAVALMASRNGIPARYTAARSGWTSTLVLVGSLVLGFGLLGFGVGSAETAAGVFFGGGSCMLVFFLAAARRYLVRCGAGSEPLQTVATLGLRNAGRRVGRSLATVALLASGAFLVAAIQSNRLEPPRDPGARASGTGGFAFFGRSTLPVLRDLGSAEGRASFGLSDAELEGVSIVPVRVREGDDASCLNLGVPTAPRLLGVNPSALADRGAFRFAASAGPAGAPSADPWRLLDVDYGDDVVPAIGDQASILWTMHKSVGEDLEYRDERGQTFRVRIVGAVADSILQGDLVVAESHLQARFPSISGYRVFLIDAPPERAAAVAGELTGALEDVGMELTPTGERLAAFQQVQNTYLLIFQLLGGLGLLLGTVGMGVVVLRNVAERRSELAVLSAVGYSASAVRKMVWAEHGLLLAMGLLGGVFAAHFVTTLPRLLTGDGAGSGAGDLWILLVAGLGALWITLATVFATRGPLLRALQSE